MSKYDEDCMDRANQKVRSVGKQHVPKNSELTDNDSRIKKMEADMTKISADVKELMQLLICSQKSIQNWSGQSVQQNSQLSAQPPLSGTRSNNSAGEGLITGNFSQISQQGRQLQCWDCGTLGHTRRNCPMRSQDVSNQRRNVRSSSIRLTISRQKSTNSIPRTEDRYQVSAAESTAALQHKDPDTGPILRMLIRHDQRKSFLSQILLRRCGDSGTV